MVKLLGVISIVTLSCVVVVSLVSKYVKMRHIQCFEYMQFMVRQLHLKNLKSLQHERGMVLQILIRCVSGGVGD